MPSVLCLRYFQVTPVLTPVFPSDVKVSLSPGVHVHEQQNMHILRSRLFVSVAALFCLFLIYFASQLLASSGLRSYLGANLMPDKRENVLVVAKMKSEDTTWIDQNLKE